MDRKDKQEKEHLIGYDEFDNAGSDLIKKRKLKQRLQTAAIIIVGLVVVGICLAVFISTRTSEEETTDDFMRGFGGNGEDGTSIVTASGTTSIGMDVVSFEVDYLEDTTLYIEEVYLSSNDEVEEGTPILKITDESIEDAREELESTLESATLSYESSVISTEESKIKAKYTYEQTMLEAEQAEEVYNDKLESLEADYNKTKESYEDAKEDYEELYNQVYNGTLEDDYDVENLYNEYLEAKELYNYCFEKWELSASDLTSSSSSLGSFSSGSAGGGKQSTVSEKYYYVLAIEKLQEYVDETEEAYETAQQEYQDALENAELNLKVLKNALDTAELNLNAAEIKYQKDILSAKTTYETAKAKAQTAQNDYETTLTSLEESLDKLYDAMDEASDNLEHFEATVGDGYLYTEEAGTVLMVSVREDDALSGDDMVMAYSVPDDISVSVSVSQDYIAELEVGETATVTFSDYGTFSGTVTSINPISSSSSRTSVTYTVVVDLEGDVTELSANLTATVMFGMDASQMNQQGGAPGGDDNAPSGDGQMPSGDGNAPSGDGQMPSGDGSAPTREMPSGDATTDTTANGGQGNE